MACQAVQDVSAAKRLSPSNQSGNPVARSTGTLQNRLENLPRQPLRWQRPFDRSKISVSRPALSKPASRPLSEDGAASTQCSIRPMSLYHSRYAAVNATVLSPAISCRTAPLLPLAFSVRQATDRPIKLPVSAAIAVYGA